MCGASQKPSIHLNTAAILLFRKPLIIGAFLIILGGQKFKIHECWCLRLIGQIGGTISGAGRVYHNTWMACLRIVDLLLAVVLHRLGKVRIVEDSKRTVLIIFVIASSSSSC